MGSNRKTTLVRYFVVLVIFIVCVVAIIAKAAYTMFVKDDFWKSVQDRKVTYNIDIEPKRGDILDTNGKLLASTLPEYKLFIDLRAGGFENDTLLAHLNNIASEMHRIFPDVSVDEFKRTFRNGLAKKKKNKKYRILRIYNGYASYIQYMELRKIPYFRRGKNASGLFVEETNSRKHPYGTLAARTIGDMFRDQSRGAKNGIEKDFDYVLKGQTGKKHLQKVQNRFVDVIDTMAVNGMDVQTTIDIEIQDIVEDVLREKMLSFGKQYNTSLPLYGLAMVMEVETGDIKAMCNLGRVGDSVFVETENYCISYLMEPGSTFKTASIMVGLDDGVISTKDVVDTGNGILKMHRRDMKDHNWRKGGYQELDLQHILMYSSNIGVSKLIDDHYYSNPEKYIEGLKKLGILNNWDFQMKAYRAPYYKKPGTAQWDASTLAWMSIGYNTQLPPINTLTFYNAIANGGKLMKPRIVKAILKDNEVVEEFPVEVVDEEICRKETIDTIQYILEKVVSEGLGSKAGNGVFPVAGKTGTAMVAENGRYGNKSFVSFAGFFPADKPKYTCLVSITKTGFASGGLMSGDVFGRIAERLYARDLRPEISSALDSNAVFVPSVLKGNMVDASVVLDELGFDDDLDDYSNTGDKFMWATARNEGQNIVYEPMTLIDGLVPNVVGMGAKDAVYLMEQAGLKVRLNGYGRVKKQSIAPGTKARKGNTVVLVLGI